MAAKVLADYPFRDRTIRIRELFVRKQDHFLKEADAMTGSDDRPSGPLPRSVRTALDAMSNTSERRWTVAELAVLAGVSGRTLQRHCRTFLGKSPQEIMRDRSFDCARREFLRGRPETRVMDVALRCGFTHFGRFSIGYRHRFGETPSETISRQVRLADGLKSRWQGGRTSWDEPMIHLGPIEADSSIRPRVDDIADEIAVAMMRIGMPVAAEPRSARYQLVGAVRGTGRGQRLLLRLIDRHGGRQIWAHRIDDPVGASADIERLAAGVVGALQPGLRAAEIDQVLVRPLAELGPRELALRAMPGVLSLDEAGNARALELLERALACDPSHALSAALAAWVHAQRVVYHFTADIREDRARGLELARRAQTRSSDPTVLAVVGTALTLLDKLDGAALVIQKALAANGASAWAWSRSGWLDVYRGDSDSAIERFKIALDLAPQDPLAFNSTIGIGCAYFYAGNYAAAARWQARGLAEHPSAAWVHRTLCPAYVLTGARPEAGRSLGALRSSYPDLTLSQVQLGMPPLQQTYRDLILEALSEAGLPD
ncbi:helix-turn-helix domain-containing protein [Bradyrhizobium sp. MOS003]|uniref:helix-turn-helix domain-containing protein n=1 Tax=Bradyrhizobium sp. MOS003 TaxID=2133946 RepID=UPI0011BF2330|nr:helix-turn-helix domain-containing protein [Bradyrhizobium sp. MOS003]